MNKSTPLTQLPNTNSNTMQTQNFVTDQQRQYISQAQNAISNSHMPQNTQLSADIINDDDVVVQDILNQINASTENTQQSNEPTPQQIQQINHQIMMQQMAAQQQQQNIMASQQSQQINPSGGLFNPAQTQQALLMAQLNNLGRDNNPYDNIIQNPHPTEFKDYLLLFADDLKLAGLVFIIVILVHFLPLDKLISKYFTIDKIPYHKIILRAIMAAIIIIVVKKLVKI